MPSIKWRGTLDQLSWFTEFVQNGDQAMSLAVSVDAFSHPPHDNALFRRVLEHAMAALEDAQVSSEPYCHFYAENVLPTDFFRELIANFPDRSNYVPLNLKVWVRENGESTRDRLVFTEELFGRLSEEQCLFWRTVTDVLASDKLRQIAFRLLAKDVAARFGIKEDEVDEIETFSRTVLFRDTEAYKIKPHADGTTRIVTMMLYLPADLSQEDLGTSVYVKQPLLKRLGGETFKEIKRFPYRPNSLSAFAVNRMRARTSWHGVEQFGPNRGVRNSLLTQYRTNDDGPAY